MNWKQLLPGPITFAVALAGILCLIDLKHFLMFIGIGILVLIGVFIVVGALGLILVTVVDVLDTLVGGYFMWR